MTAWRAALLALLLLAIGLPLFWPFRDALASPGAWQVWTDGGRLLGLARNTLLLLAGTLALALPAGLVGAILLYRTDLPGRGIFHFLMLLTLFVPLPLFASGWQAALGSGGLFSASFWNSLSGSDPDISTGGLLWKPWGRGLNAAIWIHAIAALPWVVLLVGQGLRWVERDLEEEALTFAGPWRVLWSVTLRRSLAAIGAAVLWVTLQTATEITVTDMFQVRTLAEVVYMQYVAPEAVDAVARAVVASLPCALVTVGLVLAATTWWERRLPPLERLAATPHVYRLGRARWPIALVLAGLVAVLAGVPVGSLIWKLGLGGTPRHWMPAVAATHLDFVLKLRWRLVLESLGMAALAGAATAVLALLTCWLAIGSRWFQAALLLLIAIAWALPGPVVGLGLKGAINFLLPAARGGLLERVLYLGPSPVPAMWVYLVRFFPCAVAVLWPVVRLLPRELREAAWVDGAGPGRELWHVVGPLTRPALLQAALVASVLALGELSAGKLVETPGSQTFTHEVFTQMHYGVTNDLAALCLILLAAVLLGGVLVAASAGTLRHLADR